MSGRIVEPPSGRAQIVSPGDTSSEAEEDSYTGDEDDLSIEDEDDISLEDEDYFDG